MNLIEMDKELAKIPDLRERGLPLLIAFFQEAYIKQQPLPENGKFIEITTLDYNYTDDLKLALEYIWLNIYKENNHLRGIARHSNRTIPEMIIELNNAGRLKPLIQYTWRLVGRMVDVVWAVQGLTDEPLDPDRIGMLSPELESAWHIYENIIIEVHDNNDFAVGKNYNSERVWLNLETGRAEPF